MILIGITGGANVGKTTIAEYIHERHGFMYYNLEHPLIAGIAAIFQMNPVDVWTYRDQPFALWNELTARVLKEWLGRSMRDLIGEDALTRVGNLIIEGAEKQRQQGLVVDGVSTEREYRWILRHGGQIWEINRPAPAVRHYGNWKHEIPDDLCCSFTDVNNDRPLDETKNLVDSLVGLLRSGT